MSKTIIIAEIGVNHNGCVKTAKRLINAAKDVGLIMLNSKHSFLNCLLQNCKKK